MSVVWSPATWSRPDAYVFLAPGLRAPRPINTGRHRLLRPTRHGEAHQRRSGRDRTSAVTGATEGAEVHRENVPPLLLSDSTPRYDDTQGEHHVRGPDRRAAAGAHRDEPLGRRWRWRHQR